VVIHQKQTTNPPIIPVNSLLLAKANEWYTSDDYQPMIKLRLSAASGIAIVLKAI
jgi:uncharacterized protein (DUF1330 family)